MLAQTLLPLLAAVVALAPAAQGVAPSSGVPGIAQSSAVSARTSAPVMPFARGASACSTPTGADAGEPACNRHLAASPWASNHRNSYAQASSPFPGPTGPAEQVNVDHDGFASAPVVVSFSPKYPKGGRVIWASTVGFTGEILKIDPKTVTVIDKYIPQVEEGAGLGANSVSGAYNLVDADNRLHVGQATSLEVYGDAVPGRRRSSIALLRRFDLPARALCGEDQLVGITMTYDGHIAFATENGVVGVVPRQPGRMNNKHLRTFSINGRDCAGGRDGEVETVSNSIAADEKGGLYVVTSHAMYRIDWRDKRLSQRWRSVYEGAGGSGGGRLGAGSGSTPTLMGTGPRDDRFVVITDGQELMHLVLMWRDRIPAGWKPIRKGADRRIACEIPVTFGDESAERSLSEQSVLVRDRQCRGGQQPHESRSCTGPAAAGGGAVLPTALRCARERAPRRRAVRLGPKNEHLPRGLVEPGRGHPQRHPDHERSDGADLRDRVTQRCLDPRGTRLGQRRREAHRGDHRVPDEQQLLRRHHHRPRRNSLDRQLRRRHTLPTLRPEARGRLWPASGPSRGRDRNRAPGSRGRTAGHHRPTER